MASASQLTRAHPTIGHNPGIIRVVQGPVCHIVKPKTVPHAPNTAKSATLAGFVDRYVPRRKKPGARNGTNHRTEQLPPL